MASIVPEVAPTAYMAAKAAGTVNGPAGPARAAIPAPPAPRINPRSTPSPAVLMAVGAISVNPVRPRSMRPCPTCLSSIGRGIESCVALIFFRRAGVVPCVTRSWYRRLPSSWECSPTRQACLIFSMRPALSRLSVSSLMMAGALSGMTAGTVGAWSLRPRPLTSISFLPKPETSISGIIVAP